MTVGGIPSSGSYLSNGTGSVQLNGFQSATVNAVQQAIRGGKGSPQLQQDLQDVENAKSPDELRHAMHKLRHDAKAAGIELPHGKGKGKAGGKGKGGGDDQMVTVTDPATGQTYQVPASQAASIMSGGGGGLFAGSQYTTAALPGANKYSGGV